MKVREVQDELDDCKAIPTPLAQGGGCGPWSTALPIQSKGYALKPLRKDEFKDSVF